MLRRKRGEAYIDTVVTVFLSLMVIAVSLNLYSYYTAYHRLDYIAQEMLRISAMRGETAGTEIEERFDELKSNTGLGNDGDGSHGYGRTENLSYSYEGSEIINNANNVTGAVQIGNVIRITLTCNAKVNLMGKTGIVQVPMSITKTGLSEYYWKNTQEIEY